LAQYDENDSGCLHDRLEGHNVVLVARSEGSIAGFIAITPPGAGPFSVERYFAPSLLPLLDRDTYEIRALTVRTSVSRQ
jgi:hypothetical protein